MKALYEIQRVMNNNVILAKELNSDDEVVLMGKGLGFGKTKGERLHPSTNIEKAFKAGSNRSMKDNYLKMLEEINGQVVEICTEILLLAEKKLGNLSDRSFIVVVDHISFAIEKIDKNIRIENPFVYEIEQLYPDEYVIGTYARQLILEKLHVDITLDEVGFIALHLNAAKEHQVVKDTLKNTRLIKSMVNIIERALEESLKETPMLNNRLLTHLRGMIQRIDSGKSEPRHPLYDVTIRECKEAFNIVSKIALLLDSEKKQMKDTDKFYLTLHVDRLIRLKDND